MKKLIFTLAILVPALSFAQNEINQKDNQTENPFVTINTQQYVDQEYIDISQTVAILNISNTTRSATRGASSLINIPREFVQISQLTEGMEKNDQDRIKSLLNK